ncbi:MAG: S41 family peptidase [Bacteroidota bacterium]|nr:S41 family peptidase [Bacteroidota bacterium]
MNNMKRSFSILISFLFFYGCDEMIVGSDPTNTPESNFEIFWKDFDRYYAQFSLRHINWDSVYTLYRPRITPTTSDGQLFNIFSNIVYGINDMHVTLYSPMGDVYWEPLIPASYPSRRIINAGKYVRTGAPQNSVLEYRTCQDPAIGYIIIRTFEGQSEGLSMTDSRYLAIDDILSQWKNMKGIIIDVRGNSGGNGINAETVADRFADQSRVYLYQRQKNGPGKDNFSSWKSMSIEPKGSYQFLKPVVVLTSRATMSSAEMFVMAMQNLPQVTIVGDTTAGGIGNPIFRELPNGWTYRLSTGITADAQGRIMEGVGVFPDVPVLTTSADSANGIDRILEKGIEIIKNSK